MLISFRSPAPVLVLLLISALNSTQVPLDNAVASAVPIMAIFEFFAGVGSSKVSLTYQGAFETASMTAIVPSGLIASITPFRLLAGGAWANSCVLQTTIANATQEPTNNRATRTCNVRDMREISELF